MSKSGRNYTKEKIRQRHMANKKRKHPIHLFIRSWDFWGKSFLGLLVFGMFIYSLNDNVTIHFFKRIVSLLF
ncbi:hypothetical protein ISO84_01230 [Morganella morganii subsp. morganii]|nr:hypothetical protein [Morganella morganii subsp. morganii]